MAITVKQALEIGGLQKGRVLAGSQHLDRVIHHVNILEAPWESFWDSHDHLFLTSFYALRNDTPLQIENVQGLAENGCAALVFQKGVQDILDPLVIQQAEESGLPLIEVEEAISLSGDHHPISTSNFPGKNLPIATLPRDPPSPNSANPEWRWFASCCRCPP